MLTVLQLAVRVLSWSLIGLGLTAVLVLVRLGTAPIELGWLQPRIERALAPERDDLTVTTERIELRLNPRERTLELVGVDVRYLAAEKGKGEGERSSTPLLVFPEVELALSVEALLKHGRIAASAVHAKAPSLMVERNQDGIIDLHLEDGAASGVDLGALLQRFVQPPEADARIGFLETLEISGGRVAFYDRLRASALTTSHTDLKLTRRGGGVDAWLRADIMQISARPASIQINGRIERGAERMGFGIDVADLMPADLPALWPLEDWTIPAVLAGVRLPLQATIEGDIGTDGSLSSLALDVRATTGLLDLPKQLAEPLEVERAELKGRLGSDLASLDIDDALIVSRGARLGFSGETAWRDGVESLALDLKASAVRTEDLAAFWPLGLGQDARSWVVDNIGTGRIGRAEARIDIGPGDLSSLPLPAAAIDGRFDFEDLSVRYLDEMPPIEGAFGEARFDADRMNFDVAGGTNAGVTLKGGSVTIGGMGKPGKGSTTLRVLADAEGSIERLLALLDHPPLALAQELDIAPADTAGRFVTSIEVRLPLHDDVTEEDALVLAEADLIDLALDRLPKLDGDVRLDQGAFDLTVGEDTVRLDGRGSVNGIPLDIEVIEPRDEDTSTRRIVLAGSLSRAQLEAEGVVIDGLDGQMAFDATVTETGTHFWIDLKADLTPLAFAPPGLAWKKLVGADGLLRASIAVPLDGPIEVKQFEVTSGELDASGSLVLSEAGLQSLVLDRLQLVDTDTAIRYAPDGEGGYDLVVEAERLDLDTLLGEEDKSDPALERFHVVLRADQLRVRGIELLDVQGDAIHSSEGWRTASAIGTLPAGGKVALELTPEDVARRLEVRSDNAGALIEALDLGQRVEGGTLLLSTRIEAEEPLTTDGRFEIADFVLRDAPLLARMLTLASLNGIGNLLGGEGIQMEHLMLPFTLGERTLTFTDGLMRGSQLGLTIKGDVALDEESMNLAGTIIPVYSLNRLIGQVPVIGRILTGVDGEGAFAATYSIEGPNDNPTVYVNPLSILTPGLLRDLFGGLINGTLEPPELRETDD